MAVMLVMMTRQDSTEIRFQFMLLPCAPVEDHLRRIVIFPASMRAVIIVKDWMSCCFMVEMAKLVHTAS